MAKYNYALIAAFLIAGTALPVKATLVGDTVGCRAEFVEFELICNPASATVGDGVEFTLQDPTQMILDLIEVDPDSASITFTNTNAASINFLPGDLVELFDLDWVGEPLAVLVGIANFATNVAGADASDVSFGPHSVTIDLSEMSFGPNGFLTFDLVKGTATPPTIPLPAPGLLLLGGLTGLGLLRRRRSGSDDPVGSLSGSRRLR